MSENDLQTTIGALVDDLRPSPGFRPALGLALTAGAALVTIALVAATVGIRSDALAGRFEPLLLIANGLFLLLGAAAGSAAVAMASPQVGRHDDGWRWGAATVALLPLTVLVLVVTGNEPAPGPWMDAIDGGCLLGGVASGAGVALALTAWLRRGAPASPQRAGLLVGIAAGSFGILATALHCPSTSLYHVGVWHAAAT